MRLKDEKFYKTVRDFLDIYLIRHKGYSANTQKSYREALNLLLLYFKTELDLEYVNIGFEDITYSNITGFLEWLSSSRNCSPATINLRLMAIRSFTKYAGILDPAKIHTQVEISNISIRKMPGKVVEFLSMPALNTLMEQPNRLKANGYRDFCFMKLMYDTAARCRELVNAKIGDLDLRKSYTAICLTGKGNKMRVVPISPSMSALLKEYMDTVHPIEQRQNSDYLFFTTLHGRRTRMSTDTVSLFMKSMANLQTIFVLKFPNGYILTNSDTPEPCTCIVPVCRSFFSRSFLDTPMSTRLVSMHGQIRRQSVRQSKNLWKFE